MSALTESPAWKALAAHHASLRDTHVRTLFAEDPKRFDRFSLRVDDVPLVDSRTASPRRMMKLLFALARQAEK